MIRRRESVALCALGAWGALTAIAAHAHQPRSSADLMDALMWNREPIGGPFTLTDQQGRLRRDTDFHGKLMLVYFGFTHCPDVCPTDLHEIGLAMGKLGPLSAGIQPIFVTLDPQRDTPRRLASYLSAFPLNAIGLTGSRAAIRQVADSYRVYFRKVPLAHGDYVIEHAAVTFLMDRDGRYLGFFPPGTQADRLVEVIRPHAVS